MDFQSYQSSSLSVHLTHLFHALLFSLPQALYPMANNSGHGDLCLLMPTHLGLTHMHRISPATRLFAVSPKNGMPRTQTSPRQATV